MTEKDINDFILPALGFWAAMMCAIWTTVWINIPIALLAGCVVACNGYGVYLNAVETKELHRKISGLAVKSQKYKG